MALFDVVVHNIFVAFRDSALLTRHMYGYTYGRLTYDTYAVSYINHVRRGYKFPVFPR